MSTHTPEPWAVGVGVDGTWGRHHAHVRTDNIPLPIASTVFFGITPREECEANAARIVACVNALAGIPDPAAEMARLRAVEASRETMRSVLWAIQKRAAFRALGPIPTTEFERDVLVMAERALANAAKIGGPQ